MSPNLVSLLIVVGAVAITAWQIRRSRLVRDTPDALIAQAGTGASDAIIYYWRPG